jgi:hypothetical protein
MKLTHATYNTPKEKVSVISWGRPVSSRTAVFVTNDQIKDVENRIFED